MHPCKKHQTVTWIFQLIAATILIRMIYLSFIGHEDLVRYFSKLGLEPWGRIGTGLLELPAAVMLVSGRFSMPGALMAQAIMGGLLACHTFKLGAAFDEDAGLQLALALTVFSSTGLVMFLRRTELPWIGHRFAATYCDLSIGPSSSPKD